MKPAPKKSKGESRPSDRELILLRALAALTTRATPEISAGELALRVGLGRPTKELWRQLDNLERKGFVAVARVPGSVGEGASLDGEIATSVRVRLTSGRLDEAFGAFFRGVLGAQLGFADDEEFLASLVAWGEQEYALVARRDKREGAGGAG